ncbi:leucine-rich repeat-containing protein 15-like [Dendronephthya gigantea]|uniref:leucine-rich repeat-containing protein 15-like n=1 Tax=Dendronephthya gigantea TaxID=151771 RepID=UPI00106D0B29|nr:leucine-rich repeat-containing protein 15-like [Dendronephthya gigantea]
MQATTTFPRGVFNNDTKWLIIEKSSITNLTKDDFIGLPVLEKLDMSEGILNYIQDGTFQELLNLKYVSLKDNKLASFVPGIFANLSKLELVHLSKNPFESLPDGIFENSPLKKLYITHSKLNSTGLNGIGSGGVTKTITELHVDYSNIPRLAKNQFSGLSNLEKIGLLSCNIQYIGADFLQGTKVKIVDLYSNNIVQIDPDAMSGITIEWFDCRYCGLTTEKVFGNDSFLLKMTSLERLDLGHNEITQVPKGAFEGLTKLTTLLLFYNNISTIEENPFTELKLESFGIQENPFNCDCHLAWFHKYALVEIGNDLTGKDVLKKMKCASPSNLAGKIFPDLNASQFCCTPTKGSAPVCGNDTSKAMTLRPIISMLLMPYCLIFLFTIFPPW